MQYLTIYFVFCLIGFVLEWGYGMFWDIVGSTPWIYPNSILHYTSFEGIPLWGFGGVVCVLIYKAIIDRKPKRLLEAIIPLMLAAIWIVIYAQFIA